MLGYLRKSLETEQENRPLFIPIFIGVGISAYFALSFEPSLTFALALAFGTAAIFFMPRETGAALRGALFCTALGFIFATIRTATIDTRLLSKPIRNANVQARVIDLEQIDGDIRATLDQVRLSGRLAELDKIRIRFSREFKAPLIGSDIALRATLLPPFPPPTYGAFDFRRFSYFKGFSATGRAFDGWESVDTDREHSSRERVRFSFLNLRARINERILSRVEGPSAGVLLSMMTGDIYAVPEKISSDYRAAGIIHMISISGFHMSAVAALVFLLVRKLLALSMVISARYNTKKLAALITVAATLFYLLLSGGRIPATRAFIMLNLAMLAIVIDRRPFSMRLLAASAIIILALMPESILNLGFQLSFLAVAVLVRIYEERDRWMVKNKLANAAIASALTSGIISLAASPFIIHSFGTFEPYAILGNVLTLPIASLAVMPAIVAAFIAMPFGLDGIFLKAGGYALDAINFICAKIAELPGAIMSVHAMEGWQIAIIACGIVWILAWRGSWKWLGLAPVALGTIAYLFSGGERVFADRYGTLFGVAQGGTLSIVNLSNFKPDKLITTSWRERSGAGEVIEAGGRSDFGFAKFINGGAVIDGQFYGRKFFHDKLGGEWLNGRWRFVRDYVGDRPWAMPTSR